MGTWLGSTAGESRPNIFGGQDYISPGGGRIQCRPNIFGGQDCR